MAIIVDKEKLAGDFHISVILTEKDNEEFQEGIKRNGESEVDFGGTFFEKVTDEDSGEETEVEVFNFNQKLHKIPSQLPFTRIFKSSIYGENAEKFADIYATTIAKRIDLTLDRISKKDTFSDKDIVINFK